MDEDEEEEMRIANFEAALHPPQVPGSKAMVAIIVLMLLGLFVMLFLMGAQEREVNACYQMLQAAQNSASLFSAV